MVKEASPACLCVFAGCECRRLTRPAQKQRKVLAQNKGSKLRYMRYTAENCTVVKKLAARRNERCAELYGKLCQAKKEKKSPWEVFGSARDHGRSQGGAQRGGRRRDKGSYRSLGKD